MKHLIICGTLFFATYHFSIGFSELNKQTHFPVVEITSSKSKTCKIISKKGLFADFAKKCSTLTGVYYQRWQGSCQQVENMNKKIKKTTVDAKMCDTKNAKARNNLNGFFVVFSILKIAISSLRIYFSTKEMYCNLDQTCN